MTILDWCDVSCKKTAWEIIPSKKPDLQQGFFFFLFAEKGLSVHLSCYTACCTFCVVFACSGCLFIPRKMPNLDKTRCAMLFAACLLAGGVYSPEEVTRHANHFRATNGMVFNNCNHPPETRTYRQCALQRLKNLVVFTSKDKQQNYIHVIHTSTFGTEVFVQKGALKFVGDSGTSKWVDCVVDVMLMFLCGLMQ